MCLFLTACGSKSTNRPAVEHQSHALLPDAGLVAECDTSEGRVSLNGDFPIELENTRAQRDSCAAQVRALLTWREKVKAFVAEMQAKQKAAD